MRLCLQSTDGTELCAESRIWTPAAIDARDVKIEQLRLVKDQRLIALSIPAFHNFSYLAAGRSLVLVEIFDEDGKLVFRQSTNRPDVLQLSLNPRRYTLRLTPSNAAGVQGRAVTIPLDVPLLTTQKAEVRDEKTSAAQQNILNSFSAVFNQLMQWLDKMLPRSTNT